MTSTQGKLIGAQEAKHCTILKRCTQWLSPHGCSLLGTKGQYTAQHVTVLLCCTGCRRANLMAIARQRHCSAITKEATCWGEQAKRCYWHTTKTGQGDCRSADLLEVSTASM
jgi:hypothetical protein